MDKSIKFSILFPVLLIILNSCNKKEGPEITTLEVTNITGISAISGGIIPDNFSSVIITRGICWSTDVAPEINDSRTSDSSGAGTFTSNLTGLYGNTVYFVRAFATTDYDTLYGNERSFTTLDATDAGIDVSGMIKVGDIYIDKYEAPNIEGELPFVMFTYFEAQNWCGARGKRLLYDDEWESIAGGLELMPYVYGDIYNSQICNTSKTWRTYNQILINDWPSSASSVDINSFSALLEAVRAVSSTAAQSADHIEFLYQADPSGKNFNCFSLYNIFDLNGNVQEWTKRRNSVDPDFQGNIKGGYWSESRTIQDNLTSHGNAFRFYNLGFRCAKDAGK